MFSQSGQNTMLDVFMPPPPLGGGIKRWCCLTSVCRVHRACRKQVKRSRSPDRFTHRGVYISGSCSGERVKVFTVGTFCYVAICRREGRLGGVSAPTAGGKGRGISWRPPTYTLFICFRFNWQRWETYCFRMLYFMFTDVCRPVCLCACMYVGLSNTKDCVL